MLQLIVEAIQWQTDDAATFFLKEINGRIIPYKAGQFITLVFAHHQNEIRRSYSLSSAPGEVLLSITVKRIANGEISRFLLSKSKVGDIWNALEPAGKFTIAESTAGRDIFYFAAGSGIVPVYAHLKAILKQASDSNITLVYSVRTRASALFYTELAEMAQTHAGFKLICLFSEGNGNMPQQRLNNEMVTQLVNSNSKFNSGQTLFFLCGPFVYMRMIKLTLMFMHYKPSQIRKENFVIDSVPDSNAFVSYPPRQIKINLAGTGYDLIVGENQSILNAALQNGIKLPYSCKAGICSSCTAICSNGKVAMDVNDVLTDEDLKANWILTCTGHPVTDDVIVEFL